ncbi:hypothetical protein [Pseudofrankia sp. BMG5.36]|uniref:hypothetical protein n=1 Tax=Pseudofrankia sp. BMG5.36 TaxID=1834512 RepID=UPI0008D996C4|nr:hypothetical protein [Pseudofrankia sp. BMG5.36]OHV44400.1 hypothetical protein BCD48_02355 [Pseudofrankia sp. BMG5.36]
MSRAALDALSPDAKAEHDRARRVWHANIGPLRTPQMAALHDDLWDIVETNQQDGDKAKGAAAIDGYPGLGKTTATLVFAREFHRRQITEEGRSTPGGHEHLPVCWIGLGANTTIKGLNQTILDFARTTGHIGSLMTLISRGAGRAIRHGQERLTRDLLDRVKADEGAEQSRAPLQAALDAGRLTPHHRALRTTASADA